MRLSSENVIKIQPSHFEIDLRETFYVKILTKIKCV